MAMDLIDLGSGAASGFLVSVLTLLGWNRRLNKLEDIKQDINVCHKTHEEERIQMNRMADDILYIRGRIDRIYDSKFNGKI